MRKAMVSLMLLAGLAGCDDSMLASDQQVQAQTEYDFTVTGDRARWREEDLLYQGSVGPYAIYRVTGQKPRLVGPFVRARRTQGFSMLCGGTKYFTAAANLARRAVMTLNGGRHGDVAFCHADQDPTPPGTCSPPKDVFGNPLPDMGGDQPPPGGGGPSDDLGPLEPPVFDPPGTDDGGDTGATPDNGSSGDIHQMVVGLTEVPPMDSMVLVRRVAITDEREHNGSHVIPNICCQDGQCTLQQ